MTVIECVKKIFEEPKMSNDMAEAILWGCTGYPCFWTGDPIKCFVQQLRHAKRSLARGFTIDEIYVSQDTIKMNPLLISDGLLWWSIYCPKCGKKSMVVMGRGKAKCKNCGHEKIK